MAGSEEDESDDNGRSCWVYKDKPKTPRYRSINTIQAFAVGSMGSAVVCSVLFSDPRFPGMFVHVLVLEVRTAPSASQCPKCHPSAPLFDVPCVGMGESRECTGRGQSAPETWSAITGGD